jgi:hypothetical protein
MSKHWTWEKVKAEMDAAIAEGLDGSFELLGVPAALFIREIKVDFTGDPWAESAYDHYREHSVFVDPTKPDGIKTLRVK